MKQKILRKGLSVILSLGMLLPAFPVSWADSEILGAGAPPSEFAVYINVDGSTEPTFLKKYSAAEMRTMAADSKDKYINDSSYDKMTRNGTIYYTARTQYSYYSGRAVTEYILMSEFLKDTGVEFGENDYFIMGPDYTIDPEYRDEYNFGSSQENYERYWYNYGWYDHGDIISDSRYYFQNWNTDTKFKVPSVIALKSYGGDGWTAEGYWEMYAGQSDYLWAYVINFGQENIDEATYNRFYRQNTQCTIKLGKDDPADRVVSDLLAETVREANKELSDTVTGTSSTEVPEDKYWVPEVCKNTLQDAINDNGSVSGTNEAVYNAYLTLKSALKDFNDAKQSGAKVGFTWFSEEEYNETQRYTIRTKNQMLELAQLVNGTADLGEHVIAGAYDFQGKTIELTDDVALDRNRIIIGNADYPFKGTFDGGGHTLSGIKVNANGGYAALFGNNQGTIKNLTLSGDITQTAGDTALAAGIAAYNSGTIENCMSYAEVTAPNVQAAGGIAGINTGSILNSGNLGTINGGKICGGIAGENTGSISGNINTEKVKSESASDETAAGGIVGLNDTGGTIENSINTGDISALCNTVGGIAGMNRSAVSNCYSTGGIDGTYETGGIAGEDSGTVNNCYYLEGSVKNSSGNSAVSSADCKTKEEMLSAGFVQLINSGSNKFAACSGNYPRLSWQHEYVLLFDTDGGTLIEDQKMGQYFKPLRPDDPQKDNSTFAGWYADEENITEYDFSVPITEDRIIYAKWNSGSGDSGSGTGGSGGDSGDSGSNIGGSGDGSGGSGSGTGGSGGGSGGSGGSTGGSGGGSGSTDKTENDTKDNVVINPSANGSVSISPSAANAGDQVTISIVPNEGYETADVKVTGESGQVVQTKKSSENTYIFTMPQEKITIDVTYKLKSAQNAALHSFSDVAGNAWYNSAVQYVTQNGYFNGTSDNMFSPDSSMTRAMFATVLGRLAGIDESVYTGSPFNDVQDGQWYSACIKWASDNNIINGVGSGNFNPNAKITREQMAVMLYRYAEFSNQNTQIMDASIIDNMSDGALVSGYAREAVIWAVGKGVINGTGTGLAPKNDATRAQVAQIIMNYKEKIS